MVVSLSVMPKRDMHRLRKSSSVSDLLLKDFLNVFMGTGAVERGLKALTGLFSKSLNSCTLWISKKMLKLWK